MYYIINISIDLTLWFIWKKENFFCPGAMQYYCKNYGQIAIWLYGYMAMAGY